MQYYQSSYSLELGDSEVHSSYKEKQLETVVEAGASESSRRNELAEEHAGNRKLIAQASDSGHVSKRSVSSLRRHKRFF